MFPDFRSFKISIFFAFLFAILASAFIVVHVDVLISKPQSEILQERQMLAKGEMAQSMYVNRLNALFSSGLTLSQNPLFAANLQKRDYGSASVLLTQAIAFEKLEVGLIADSSGRVIYDPIKKTQGRKIDLNGLIERTVKLDLPFASTEVISADELASLNSNLLYDSKIRRIPSFNQIEQNELYSGDGMLMIAVIPIENHVIVLGDLLNRNFEFTDEVKEITRADVSIYQDDVRIATTLRTRLGSRFIGILLPEPTYVNAILLGQDYLFRDWYFNESVLSAAVPIQDYNGNSVGLIMVTVPEQTLKSNVVAGPQEKRMLLTALFLVSAFVSFLMALLVCAMMLPALRKMAQAATNIRKGNFEEGIKIRSFREIDDLAAELNVMSRYLRKLLIAREREIIADLKPIQAEKMLTNIETVKQIKNVERLKTILKERKGDK